MKADEINIGYSHEIEVETDEENTESMISPIKNHPAPLHDILLKAESIIGRLPMDGGRPERLRSNHEISRKAPCGLPIVLLE